MVSFFCWYRNEYFKCMFCCIYLQSIGFYKMFYDINDIKQGYGGNPLTASLLENYFIPLLIKYIPKHATDS